MIGLDIQWKLRMVRIGGTTGCSSNVVGRSCLRFWQLLHRGQGYLYPSWHSRDWRIETLGNFNGTDGLVIDDPPESKIHDGKIEFEKLPTVVSVRPALSKTKHEYITFLRDEGANYLKAYLDARISEGERLTEDSPLVPLEEPLLGVHKRPRTSLVSREIRKAMRK